MNYYTLLVKYPEGWEIAFGDYDHETVADEARDTYLDQPTKIIMSEDDTASLNRACARVIPDWKAV